jgi:N-acetylmuramoyl-L-alanine amidase
LIPATAGWIGRDKPERRPREGHRFGDRIRLRASSPPGAACRADPQHRRFLPLRERVARARGWKADLFLSIHADALPNTEMRGLSVFTQSAQASDREAAALAARRTGPIWWAGSVWRANRVMSEASYWTSRGAEPAICRCLARQVVVELGREAVLLEHPQRSADFAVLTALDVPSALVELGCLSNVAEQRLLQQRAYQQKLARGLVRAVEAYFAAHGAG